MNSERGNRGGCAVVAIVGLMLLPALYLLSFGPMYVLAEWGFVPLRVFEIVYLPLGILSQLSPAFNHFLEWYIDLWK